MNAIAVAQDGQRAVSVSDDQMLKVWDLARGLEIRSVVAHTGAVNSIALTQDGKRAVSGSDDHKVKVWNVENSQEIASFVADAPIRDCALAANLGIIIAGDDLGRTHLLQIELSETVLIESVSAQVQKPPTESDPKGFNVFLCHNTANKPAIRRICEELKQRGIRPWLDEEQIAPGTAWLDALDQGIRDIACAAVFVGRDGFGPWQAAEVRAILRKFVRRGCRVIPVVLEECLVPPELPTFLEDFQWVDFRASYPDPWTQLLWGITGRHE